MFIEYDSTDCLMIVTHCASRASLVRSCLRDLLRDADAPRAACRARAIPRESHDRRCESSIRV